MLDGPGDDRVGDTSEGAGGEVLGVGEGGGGYWVFAGVGGFELAAGVVEGAELD